jgi:hypothetical protein
VCASTGGGRARAGMETKKKRERETNPGKTRSNPLGRQSTRLAVCMYIYVWWLGVCTQAWRRESDLSRVCFFIARAWSSSLAPFSLKRGGSTGSSDEVLTTNGPPRGGFVVIKSGAREVLVGTEGERGGGSFWGGREREKKRPNQIGGTGQRRGVGASRLVSVVQKKSSRCVCVWLGLCVELCRGARGCGRRGGRLFVWVWVGSGVERGAALGLSLCLGAVKNFCGGGGVAGGELEILLPCLAS